LTYLVRERGFLHKPKLKIEIGLLIEFYIIFFGKKKHGYLKHAGT
jgi:hypothetical protein